MQAIAYCILSLITVLLHWPLPESPYWVKSYPKAQKALKWIYRRNTVYEEQLRSFQKEREHRTQTTHSSGLKSFLEPTVYKPVLLLVSIFLFQQLSGAYVVIFYAVDIFRKIEAEYEDFVLITFGAIRFIMAITCLLLSRIYGRRQLLFVSGTGMSLSCLIAFFLRQIQGNSVIISACVLMYVCFGAIGFLSIPWTLIGELFPVKVKGLVSGCMITVAYIFMFTVVTIFPFLINQLDIKFIFVIFSANSVIALLIIYFLLPETLGINFSEIESYFQNS